MITMICCIAVNYCAANQANSSGDFERISEQSNYKRTEDIDPNEKIIVELS
jgi:hypothetical protein